MVERKAVRTVGIMAGLKVHRRVDNLVDWRAEMWDMHLVDWWVE